MDVLPTVAQEVVSRYQQRVNHGPAAASTATTATTTLTASSAATAVSSAVTEDTAALLVRLWLLGSDHMDEAGNVGETAEAMEQLVEDIVDFLLRQCSIPNLSGILLRARVQSQRATLRNARRGAEVKREAVSLRLIDTIVQKRNPTAEEILGDITLYVLHYHEQLDTSNADHSNIERDTAAVLCGVLPTSQAVAFSKQDAVEKQRQLEELARVVWGIRIYYKSEGKSPGLGIVDVVPLLTEPLASLQQVLNAATDRVATSVRRTLAVLNAPTCPLDAEAKQLLQEEYHHRLHIQHLLFSLSYTLAALASRVHSVVLPSYENTLKDLRELFAHNKGAGTGTGTGAAAAANVPKRVAYPRFVQLADAYIMARRTEGEFEEVREVLSLVLESEQAYTSSLPEGFADEAVGAYVAEPPVSRAALAQVAQASIADKEASWRGYRASYSTEPPHTTDAAVLAQFPHLLFGLRGFCPVTYAKSGLLVEGKLHVAEDPASPGFIVVEGGSGAYSLPKPWTFAFSQESSLRAFAADPPRYFLPCLQQRNSSEPAIALLFGLEEYLPAELYVAGARRIETTSLSRVAGVKTDAATQTGQRDSYIDHNYRWNEWDLRREALKLVNLMNMRTHSAQTVASHFRRENATQVDTPKEVSTQTMQDAATQPPRVVQYLKGLRGTESSEIEQVKKTISY